jgi:hypothetical protein
MNSSALLSFIWEPVKRISGLAFALPSVVMDFRL